ncbi:MAG: hypothetical protein IT353_04680 [Gemmatimonadaceae bacterium]|nr:hypothetical protein [Gemmatimonadaceae bacterium]
MSAPAIVLAPPTDGFVLAQACDDADVRALLRRSVIPGAVHVAFTREPDYFAGEALAGAVDRTLGYRQDGTLIGVARLSAHTLHHNGVPARIGYFGELRLSPDATHAARVLRDGYAKLREYVLADALDGCFTSIASDNHRARRVLEFGKRFGLPAYTPLADLVTILLPVPRRHAQPDAQIDGSTATRDELSAFFNQYAAEAQLTLTWDEARWQALSAHGMDAPNFCVVRRGTEIVAAAAVWDQRAFRQTVVVRYDGALRWSRPVVNVLSRAGLAPTLPREGSVLAQGAVFGATVADNTHWPALLRALRAEATRRGLMWLVIARDVKDTQLAALRASGRRREYHTRLYDVRWPDAPSVASWDTQRPFRPEVGLL